MVTSAYNDNSYKMNNPQQIYNHTEANLLVSPIETETGVLHYNGDAIRTRILKQDGMEKYRFYATVRITDTIHKVVAIGINANDLEYVMKKNYPPDLDNQRNWRIYAIRR